ncbi:MAG: hypothetical protein CMD31_07395 [Flavobacteriales bacterium]|nr:hypothetical protein [Flavobacteriales bacterium]|tara:strand:+ start:15717 stop:16583 length:867 start_codon:yes stop_codon:yes gene_type:complete
MGTSISGSGPKGKSPLLPSWATGIDDSGSSDDEQESQENDNNSEEGEQDSSSNQTNDKISDIEYANSLRGAKSSLSHYINNRKGYSLKGAVKSYIRSTGGHKKATKSSISGIKAGNNFINFWGGVSQVGFKETLEKYDLTDCIGKSTEEVFAKIADKIAPIGSTNDEAIARAAIMMAFDKLCERMIENNQDLDTLDKLDSETLKETVVEFVSAYIFKKWVYEAGIALEKNNLTENEAVGLENEMRNFVRDEVKNGFKKMDVVTFDITEGDGKKMIEKIFNTAYSTLEK